MALPVVVQAPNAVLGSSVTSISVVYGSSVTAGNTLISAVTRQGSSGTQPGWTTNDNVNSGNWSIAVEQQGSTNRASNISYRHNSASGTITVTATISASDFTGYLFCVEVSGLQQVAPVNTGGIDETTSQTNHVSSTTTESGTDAFVMCASGLNANAGTTTPGSGYTEAPGMSSATQSFIQYKTIASQSDNGPWTSGTARIGINCMAVFEAIVSAAFNPYQPWMHRGPVLAQ